jgi:hypothetical protein
LLFNQLRGAGGVDSEETPGDSMIVSSSTMITEVRLLIVYIIVDVNVILVMNFFPLHKGMRGE